MPTLDIEDINEILDRKKKKNMELEIESNHIGQIFLNNLSKLFRTIL